MRFAGAGAVFHAAIGAAILAASPAGAEGPSSEIFTIAAIPDTQNYVDYTHQRAAGFPFDAADLLMEQMGYVASRLKSQGGDIVFVTGLGDVWQHQSLAIDPAHAARGFARAPNSAMDKFFAPTPKVREVEMPLAEQSYRIIAGKTPFSVIPGNHDYDSMWPDANHPPAAVIKSSMDVGILYAGGLSNFVSVFGADSPFFRDKPWYVAAHDGGADSAQVFTAGGYRFLHIGLQFDPPNASLEWAASILKRFPGLPTIVSTHDFLNGRGERIPATTVDNHAVDPLDNSPQMLWDKLISRNDQIFLVLCGHETAQAFRADKNRYGHMVYQILSDYQDRAQTAIAVGVTVSRGSGVGDGWMRLMTFDFSAARPTVHVHTYSTYYKKESVDTPDYAAWYKDHEQPDLTDSEFHAQDDFSFSLDDFRSRYRAAREAPSAAAK